MIFYYLFYYNNIFYRKKNHFFSAVKNRKKVNRIYRNRLHNNVCVEITKKILAIINASLNHK